MRLQNVNRGSVGVEQNRGFTSDPSCGEWALMVSPWQVVSEDWVGSSGVDQREGTVA